ncbi:unnamed protein product [Prorocentrum cordatum]|uniref:Uncharacterized protein n=1 Tax=Prorocentrum cordatum TaxID=2364126 RepID=A0ABN9VME3_9DINO|nr:unnamed protein product [Polarella glacialis]
MSTQTTPLSCVAHVHTAGPDLGHPVPDCGVHCLLAEATKSSTRDTSAPGARRDPAAGRRAAGEEESDGVEGWPPPRHPRGRAGGRRAPGGEGRRGPWPSLTAGTSVSIHNQTSTIIMSRVSAGARLGGRQSAWCSQRRGSLKPRVQHRVSRGG